MREVCQVPFCDLLNGLITITHFQWKNLFLLDKLDKNPEEPLIIFTASIKKHMV